MQITKSIHKILIVSTRLSAINAQSKLIKSELGELISTIPSDVILEEERKALSTALAILEKINQRTGFSEIQNYLQNLED